MLRTRLLRPRWLTVALVLWAAVWLTLPAPADGAPLAAGPVIPGLARGWGRRRGPASSGRPWPPRGCPPADVEVVLARLTPAERTELAQRAAELGVGGDPALLLIIGIVLLVAILLYLPMAGRMQGWW